MSWKLVASFVTMVVGLAGVIHYLRHDVFGSKSEFPSMLGANGDGHGTAPGYTGSEQYEAGEAVEQSPARAN